MMTSVLLGVTNKSRMQPFIQCMCRGLQIKFYGSLVPYHEDDVVKFDLQMPGMSSLENALSSRIFHTGSYAAPVGFSLGGKIVLFPPKIL
jgi:hypothetical protein